MDSQAVNVAAKAAAYKTAPCGHRLKRVLWVAGERKNTGKSLCYRVRMRRTERPGHEMGL
jgi:hypothetical protein